MASRSWAMAGLVLGIAVGGFIDGIVAHQLLEWHHMLSAWYPPTTEHHLRINMIGDALFHLGCLLVLLVGIGLLVVAKPVGSPGNLRRLAGWMLAGWGWFNLAEGLVDHQLLGVHHVRSGPGQLAYDLAFLALGAVLVIAGTGLGRSRFERSAMSTPTGMTTDHTSPVHAQDLRRLFDSDVQDPALVLHEGRAVVVAAGDQDRAGLEIVSSTELLRRAGKTTFTDPERDQQATQLSTAVDHLGG